MTADRIEPGATDPLGATWDGRGVNFALFSEHATAVELCLFDGVGNERRIGVPWRTDNVWHAYVPSVVPGQRYGWRVHGPYCPRQGDRFNPNKLLVDPYARALDGSIDLQGPVYAYSGEGQDEDLGLDLRDDAHAKPKSIVVDDAFNWESDNPPGVRSENTVLYELHVKGFTKLHTLVPEYQRGTFLGVASDAAIAHLVSIGVTAVELMPVHEHVDEPAVAARGMTNYWGYSTLSFFAPDRRFATSGGNPMREFKEMVKRLHAAGIEVILDVVYNHTCEGNELGPTVSLRGIDNRVYYRLDSADPRRYVDYSGCGNAINGSHPQVVKLLADSLRYWVGDMHVDGFRFDLAPALARSGAGSFDALAPLLTTIHQDPVLSRAKLIAEPWDLGVDGYQVGNFPVLWSEWNGRYRDTVRAYWRGEPKVVADLGYRLTGSSDLFGDDGRRPSASINFITAHDGFTLRDLVSYERKHNQANGEQNKDGLDENTSQNCGIEGDTRDVRILARRHTLARSLMTTLFISQGVPMLAMGDELWRTQRGNNNPYCHDSDLTWLDWRLDEDARKMLVFMQNLARWRKSHSALRRSNFLRGAVSPGKHAKDIVWLRTDGTEMSAEDWAAPEAAAIAFRLDGAAFNTSKRGAAQRDHSLVIMMNGEHAPIVFRLPDVSLGEAWKIEIDTSEMARPEAMAQAGALVELQPGSLVVWTEAREEST